MLKSMSFRTTLVAIACAISMSAHAMADTPKKVDIPAGDLRQALLQLSKQYGVVMKEYVEVPDDLLKKTKELKKYFDISFAYVSSLKAKPTTQKKRKT